MPDGSPMLWACSVRRRLICGPQRSPALNAVKAKIKALTAELDKYTAETQLMARMDVLERREKEEKEQAALLPEVQV